MHLLHAWLVFMGIVKLSTRAKVAVNERVSGDSMPYASFYQALQRVKQEPNLHDCAE